MLMVSASRRWLIETNIPISRYLDMTSFTVTSISFAKSFAEIYSVTFNIFASCSNFIFSSSKASACCVLFSFLYLDLFVSESFEPLSLASVDFILSWISLFFLSISSWLSTDVFDFGWFLFEIILFLGLLFFLVWSDEATLFLSLLSRSIFFIILIPPVFFSTGLVSFLSSTLFISLWFFSSFLSLSLITVFGISSFSSKPIFILDATFFSTAESSNAFSSNSNRLSSILVLGFESISYPFSCR